MKFSLPFVCDSYGGGDGGSVKGMFGGWVSGWVSGWVVVVVETLKSRGTFEGKEDREG